MPKPVLHIVCEKVIQDREQDGVVSLIGLFSKLNIGVPDKVPQVPSNAVAPKEWAVFSAWKPEESENGKTYQLCTLLLYPDKTPFGVVTKIELKMEFGRQAQGIVRAPGFPIGQTGSYTVVTWLEENGKQIVSPLEYVVEIQ